MNKFSKIGFVSALLGSLVGGLLVSLALLIFLPKQISASQELPKIAQPGMEIIKAMQCPRGETKRIIVRGKEDGYSPSGHEPTHLNERLLALEWNKHLARNMRTYDEEGLDAYLFETLDVPANISGGLFVLGMRTLRSIGNDTLNFGDLLTLDDTKTIMPPHALNYQIHELNTSSEWRYENGVYIGSLQALNLPTVTKSIRTISTFLDYIQLGRDTDAGTSIVEVVIGDDVQIDFMAIAVCEQPTNDKGLTWAEYTGYKNTFPNLTIFSCHNDPRQKVCDPFIGDTQCSISLPIACFADKNSPLPDTAWSEEIFERSWSGGEIAYSEPVRGDQFSTIAQANAFCAAQFGKDWRVLSWHDGTERSASAYVKTRRPGQRSWVDIKDQPYGTCWSR